VENGPHTAQCMSSNGIVVRLVSTVMIFCLCLVSMHEVQIELSVEYMTMGDGRAVE
jgi:hypothetical protein